MLGAYERPSLWIVGVYCAEQSSCPWGTYIHRCMEVCVVFYTTGRMQLVMNTPGSKNSLGYGSSWSWDSIGEAEAVRDEKN